MSTAALVARAVLDRAADEEKPPIHPDERWWAVIYAKADTHIAFSLRIEGVSPLACCCSPFPADPFDHGNGD